MIKFIRQCPLLSTQHTETITRCEALWSLLRSPKKREEMIQHFGKALTKPICVRWTSLFDSLELIVTLREKILNFSVNLGITNQMRDTDFEYLQEYLNISRPLIETINKLQGENNCSYGYLLPCLVSLRRKLFAAKTRCKYQFCGTLIDNLLNSIENRFKEFFEVEGNGRWAAIAAIIHPKFKTQWIGCLSVSVQKKVHSAVMTAATEIESVPFLSTSSNDDDNFFDFGDLPNSSETSSVFENSNAQIEVKRYLQEPITQNLLAVNSYPTVKKLFIKYNTPLPSSAPVERLFSYATMHNLPRYNRLTDQNFEIRVLEKCNTVKNWK